MSILSQHSDPNLSIFEQMKILGFQPRGNGGHWSINFSKMGLQRERRGTIWCYPVHPNSPDPDEARFVVHVLFKVYDYDSETQIAPKEVVNVSELGGYLVELSQQFCIVTLTNP